jgi:DNA-binding NarL/FixJ family response regulator
LSQCQFSRHHTARVFGNLTQTQKTRNLGRTHTRARGKNEAVETTSILDTLGATLSGLAPFVLHLEDIHEADEERFSFIQDLAKIVSRIEGVGLVVTSRREPLDPFTTLKLEPDVILMDLRMPVLNGIEATRRIHRAQPHIGILVVTVFEDDTSVFPAIRAGARGYLLKNTDQEELHRAIQTVANGGAIFSPGIAVRVMQYLTTPTPPAPKQAFDELTTREHSILEHLAHGSSNAEIAEKLGISSKTVSNNISNILLKLQATDRAKLMLMALEAGIGHKES